MIRLIYCAFCVGSCDTLGLWDYLKTRVIDIRTIIEITCKSLHRVDRLRETGHHNEILVCDLPDTIAVRRTMHTDIDRH